MLAYCRLEHSLVSRDLRSYLQEYTQEDLMNPEEMELYYKCIYYWDIHVTKSGWEFLIKHYGYEGLYEIDKNCDYCFHACRLRKGEDDSLEEYIKWIEGRMKIYPEVPDYIYKDHRPRNIAKSTLKVGKTVEEVAELFELSIEYVQELDREIKEERAQYEKEQNRKLVPHYLKAGKTAEEIAEELDVSVEYVLEVGMKMKESQLKAEKTKKTVYALRMGRLAEEVAKEIEMPLEFVLEIERKLKR